jgi:hypothetical protein
MTEWITVRAGLAAPPPAWALQQRHLIQSMDEAAVQFVRRYTREDGCLIWRDAWPGMDGSDDGYESFQNFPLFYALGGSEEVHRLSRVEWDAVTRQFTGYGQVYREFDAYYDWMHHGESSIYFYYFGLADPGVEKDRERALRFAAMYMGEDPEAPNYDPRLKLIRSPITGSRGPRFENSAEDWVTHRPILADYPPPFEDIPGCPGPKADWNDDLIFGEILKRINERMMRGDVPLNLTATSLITNAYLYTGEERYRQWVLDYVAAWQERARANGGIVPDNVGPSGQIGELMGGKWWGGYYGWRWPHGYTHILEPVLIAASNAYLLTGDDRWLEFPRGQMDRIWELGRWEESGTGRRGDGDRSAATPGGRRWVVPHRHGDQGWYDYRPFNHVYPITLWALSMAEADRERVERVRSGAAWDEVRGLRGKGEYYHAAPWYRFLEGDFARYPGEILTAAYRETLRRLDRMRHDDGDPAQWDVHHWQEINPVGSEALVQLTLGAPQTLYHGGLLHAPLRYFDPQKRRPGLPDAVAALVTAVRRESLALELVNVDPLEPRDVLLQAGAFGEHHWTRCRSGAADAARAEVGWTEIDARHFRVRLEPAGAARLEVGLQRYAHRPRYARPWDEVP